MERIRANNKFTLTLAGGQDIHQRKLKDYKKGLLEQVVPFDLFARPPVEIRLVIWELSLPEPRVLSVSSYPRQESCLSFEQAAMPPNPAALATCRESREVALKRYCLCFGTTNVYAYLPDGDILHFGQEMGPRDPLGVFSRLLSWPEYNLGEDGRIGSPVVVNKKLEDSVVRDLKEVTHLSMC